MVGNGRASKLRVDKMEMIHIRNYIYPNEEKKREGKDENKSSLPLNSNP
jgi:hypothetical protein